MKRFVTWAVIGAAFGIGLIGCGGGGGGSSSPDSTGSTTGNTTGNTTGSTTGTTTSGTGGGSTFSGHVMITGGDLDFSNTTTAGATQDVKVDDAHGNVFTFHSVFSPGTIIGGNVVIVKAGSNLFSGTYTSTTATYAPASSPSSTVPIPLTSAHLLAEDVVIPINGTITVPVSSAGGFTFAHGVQVSFNAAFDTVQTDTLSMTGTVTPSAGTVSTTLTFDGAGSPIGETLINCDFGASTGTIFMTSIGDGGPSPFTVNGNYVGPGKSFQTATVDYFYQD